MSYATQREFFNISYPNEDPKPPERKRSDGALMTYDFCTDNRAWALDKGKRSQYILDVVHKTRFKKALLHPEGQFELTKDYLIHLDVEDLADYILRLQAEIKQKNQSVHKLEETRKQLDVIQRKSRDFTLTQQQSAILDQERNEFDQQLSDLIEVIANLNDRADRYEPLLKENELLRCQLQKQRMGTADKIRLMNAEAEAKFNKLQAENYEKLEAELIIVKTQYGDLREQKRELKEQLQKAFVCQTNLAELKRQIAIEREERENVEEEMERLLILYDKQSQELHHKNIYITETNQRMESIEKDLRWSQDQLLQVIEETLEEQNISQETIKPVKDIKNDNGTEQRTLLTTDEYEVEQQVLETNSSQITTKKVQNELLAKQTDVETRSMSVDLQISNLQKQLEDVRKQLANKTSELSEIRADDEMQISNLQKQLEDIRKELSDKVAELSTITAENTVLQSQVFNYQDKIERLEDARKLIMDEFEASKNELRKPKEAMPEHLVESPPMAESPQMVESPPMVDSLEMNNLKRDNDSLRIELSKLREELSTAQTIPKVLQDDTSDRDALLKTVEDLKAELQTATDSLEEKQTMIIKMENETATLKAAQQLQDSLNLKGDAIDTDKPGLLEEITRLRTELGKCKQELEQKTAVIDTPEQNLVEEIETLRIELGKCQGKLEQRVDVIDTDKQSLVEEIEQLRNELSYYQQEQKVNTINGNKKSLVEEMEQLRNELGSYQQELEQKVDELDREKQNLIQEIDNLRNQLDQCQKEIERYKSERDTVEKLEENAESTICDVIEKDVSVEDEDEYPEMEMVDDVDEESSIGSAPEVQEEGDGDAKASNESLRDNIFSDEDMVCIGSADPDKTKIIALKIVRHGINVLVIGELDHLHREICRAIIERYLSLGHNIAAIDNAICACHRIVKTVKTMRNREVIGMTASNTPMTVVSPFLPKDEISQSKPRSKSASSAIPKDAQLLSMFSYPNQTPVQKANSRVLLGKYDPCRTRSWRVPKTPQETFFAGTLADGSRLVTRQKRNI